MADDIDGRPADTGAAYRLYAEFYIVPLEGVSCPLDGHGADIDEVNQSFLRDECHTQTTLTRSDEGSATPDTEVVHSKKQLESTCHCPVFLDFDCVPKVTQVDDTGLVIETYLPDRERLTALVEALKPVTGAVSLRRLTRIDDPGEDSSESVTLDLSDVTEKQREAVSAAIASGYYRTPREASMGDLAAELGISKSAMSRRLSAVESKLALKAFQ